MPSPRVLRVDVDFDEPDSDEEDEVDDLEEQDENSCSNAALEKELKVFFADCENFVKSHMGQNPLEEYGFKSSRPRPEARSRAQLEKEYYRGRAVDREAHINVEHSRKPALLHTCRESRQALQSFGYGLAFSTYSNPAHGWVNYSDDIFFIPHIRHWTDFPGYGILDGGSYNMGQCPRQELDRVRRIALQDPILKEDLRYYPEIHEIVQLFGHLTELLFITQDWVDWDYDSSWRGGPGLAVVDIGAEELWGHEPRWNHPVPPPNPPQGPPRVDIWDSCSYNVTNATPTLAIRAEDIRRELRSHPPVSHPMAEDKSFVNEKWTAPEVRFVVLMNRGEVDAFTESRKRFRQYIDEMYRKKLRMDDLQNL